MIALKYLLFSIGALHSKWVSSYVWFRFIEAYSEILLSAWPHWVMVSYRWEDDRILATITLLWERSFILWLGLHRHKVYIRQTLPPLQSHRLMHNIFRSILWSMRYKFSASFFNDAKQHETLKFTTEPSVSISAVWNHALYLKDPLTVPFKGFCIQYLQTGTIYIHLNKTRLFNSLNNLKFFESWWQTSGFSVLYSQLGELNELPSPEENVPLLTSTIHLSFLSGENRPYS